MQAPVVFFLLAFLAIAFANDATCQNWCNQYQTQTVCSSDFSTVENCVYWCSQFQFTLGFFNMTTKQGDMTGNTIGCRMYHLNVAIDRNATDGFNGQHCAHASITGGGVCGEYCDTYCQIEQYGNCSATYAVGANGPFNYQACNQTCHTFPTTGNNTLSSLTSNWGNHVQCRLYHAGIPSRFDITHCYHGAPHGGVACGDRCEGYCQMMMSNCAGKLPGYEDTYTECVQTCQASLSFTGPTTYSSARAGIDSYGEVGPDAMGDKLGCRTYHGTAPALADAQFHCGHASLEGGGACGDLCAVYCDAAAIACTGANAIFTNQSDCPTQCATINATVGDYLSIDGDNIHCRIYHLLTAMKSATDAATHCPHGRVTATGPCMGTTTPTVQPTAPVVAPVAQPTAPAKAPSGSNVLIASLLPIIALSVASLW